MLTKTEIRILLITMINYNLLLFTPHKTRRMLDEATTVYQ